MHKLYYKSGEGRGAGVIIISLILELSDGVADGKSIFASLRAW